MPVPLRIIDRITAAAIRCPIHWLWLGWWWVPWDALYPLKGQDDPEREHAIPPQFPPAEDPRSGTAHTRGDG